MRFYLTVRGSVHLHSAGAVYLGLQTIKPMVINRILLLWFTLTLPQEEPLWLQELRIYLEVD